MRRNGAILKIMKRELYSQVNIFGGVESPHSTEDFLRFAEQEVTRWLRDGLIDPFKCREDQSKAIIAAAVTYTPRFDEECIKRGLTQKEKDDQRLFIMEVLGHPDQLSQESFTRAWRKTNQGGRWEDE